MEAGLLRIVICGLDVDQEVAHDQPGECEEKPARV